MCDINGVVCAELFFADVALMCFGEVEREFAFCSAVKLSVAENAAEDVVIELVCFLRI